MKSYIFYPLMFLIFISSCANTTLVKKDPVPVLFQDRINAFGEQKKGKVFLHNGNIIETSKLKMMNDSLFMVEKNTDKNEAISLKEVDKIIFKDPMIGLGQGFYIGAGFGTLVGWYIGSGEEMGGLATLAGIVTGGVLGSISGYAIGSSHEFIFREKQ